MSSIIIDVSELHSFDSDEIKELEKFLKEKLKAEFDVGDREITVKPVKKGEMPSKDYLRVLLKKYLHKAELKGDFRVIAGKEDTLIIKAKKAAGEAE